MPKNAGFKGFQNIPTYVSAPGIWSVKQVYDALKSGPWPKQTPIDYLIVAGGGGGGGADNETEAGGGGGGGGFRFGVTRVNFGVGVAVAVGTGGAGGPTHPTTPQLGSRGGSSFIGSIISNGGGGGEVPRGPGTNAVTNGGCGGGTTSRNSTFGLGNTPATDPPQGFNGRKGIGNDGGGGGGGGGEASGSIFLGGPGGTSSLSGSSATYSVGGQGGRGTSTAGYNAGGANTGTGGAGGYGRGAVAGGDQTSQGGRNGGSGIVIIRYPEVFPALTVPAGLISNPPVVSDGYRTYVFTSGSGTLSF